MAVPPQPMVLPDYGHGALAGLLPSVASRLGVPGAIDEFPDLPDGDRFVVLLLDGLGADLLAGAAADAPFLTGLLPGGRVITAGTPSTTVTSLTSLGTGLPPGQHGMAGYSFRLGTGILNALLWDTPQPAERVQSRPTWFAAARTAGVSVTSVSPAHFEGSGLTRAALRGPDFVGIADETRVGTWVESVAAAAQRGDRSLVYAYQREIDHIGHGFGVGSAEWSATLRALDGRVARLRAGLPAEVCLIITADHGMIDVPGRNFLILEEERSLTADLTGFAGEGRLRHLYTADPDAVAARWADRLGDHAWVRTRTEATDEGWFGPVDERVRDRFGDVLVAMRTDWAVMSRTLPRELDLIGMHGSLTPVEMRVPLLVA